MRRCFIFLFIFLSCPIMAAAQAFQGYPAPSLGSNGPNPYIDVKAFGVRPVDRTVAPAIPGVTVNCVSGSPNVTISTASTFQNGDGVALYGCGSDTVAAPAAPTVTPSLAAGLTGMQLDVPGPTGSTTYCYQLVARSLLGATNVSPETCTTTGPTSLGLQTSTVTSVTLTNSMATYTTSAPHGLVVGAAVQIAGVTIANAPPTLDPNVNPFVGWFQVFSVPDTTHFTLSLMTDTRAGGITSGTGGTVSYWNCIKVKATETTNNYEYYVYGRVSGGTKTVLQAMWPQFPGLAGVDNTYLVLDDFGPPVTAVNLVPLYIPNTVPSTATNGMLSAKIVSGAGTTSLVLTANAGNTINGQTILLDDAITFLDAVAYALNTSTGTVGPLMFANVNGVPYTHLVYIFNSPISFSNVAIEQQGEVWLNEPITLTGNVTWYGEPTTAQTCPGFSFGCKPFINIVRANPGFEATTDNFVRDIAFSTANSNGVTFWIQEGGGTPVTADFRDVDFVLNVATTYSNIGYLARGNASSLFADHLMTQSSVNGNLIGTTPSMYFDNTGDPIIDGLNFAGVGIAFKPNPGGSLIKANNVYCQGCYEPLFSIAGFPAGGSPTRIFIKGVTRDTMNASTPVVADISGQPMTVTIEGAVPSVGPLVTGSFAPGQAQGITVSSSNSAGSSTPQNLSTAKLVQSYNVNDGIFGQGANLGVDVHDQSVLIGPGFSLFTTTGFYPAPACPVSAGGSVPVGTFTYAYVPVFANGSEGQTSYSCTAVTTTGNQTVTVSWSAIPGAIQYQVGRNVREIPASPITGTTFVDTFASTAGPNFSSVAVGGPAGMQNGQVWAGTFIAAPTPAPSGVSGESQLYFDSTTLRTTVNENNTGATPISKSVCVNVTPVTVSANVTTDQNLMACTLPANILNLIGRTLRITTGDLYTTPVASVATINTKVKLCTVSGCGSGTVINLANITSSGNPGSVTNNSINLQLVSTTQTGGASSAYESHGNMVIDLGASPGLADSTFSDSNTATIGTIDSTAQLFLQITGAFSVASASNSRTERQLIVEVLN
jgi:hypothetical protein